MTMQFSALIAMYSCKVSSETSGSDARSGCTSCEPSFVLKVWFWRFRSPHKEIVQQHLQHQAQLQQVVTGMNKRRDAVMSEAKSQLGLWSDAGIEESRKSFWWGFTLLI